MLHDEYIAELAPKSIHSGFCLRQRARPTCLQSPQKAGGLMTCPPGCRVWASRSSRRDEEWTDDGRLRGDSASAFMALSCLSNQRHVSVEFKISTPAMGTEQCKLGTSDDGAELRVQILKSFLQICICEKLKKKLKNKKFGRHTQKRHQGRHIFRLPDPAQWNLARRFLLDSLRVCNLPTQDRLRQRTLLEFCS